MKTASIIKFFIDKISTKQFALIEEAFSKNEEIEVNSDIKIAVDKSKFVLTLVNSFRFIQKGCPFLIIEIQIDFVISQDSWKALIEQEGKIVIPKSFIVHLAMIAAGTARGIIHAKTEGTNFNSVILQPVDVTRFFEEDLVL